MMKKYILSALLLLSSVCVFAQSSYPVHVGVQVQSPYGLYLSDYYSGSRDRLVVTLLNRDMEQPSLQVKLRVVVRNGSSFSLQSRDELYYPPITLDSGIPLRLTSSDLAYYLTPDRISLNGRLNDGKLPTGMTEFRVQALDHATGRILSEFGTGRAWLEIKQPPMLNLPAKDEQIDAVSPQYLRFQWMPRHQGLASTVYEFVLKELPDNGAAPQSAFLYGNEIFRTETRQTTLNYTHLDPQLIAGKRYGWQVRAVAMDGVDEIGMFENNGYSEIGWFTMVDYCRSPQGVTARTGYRKMTINWIALAEHSAFVVQYRPKSENELYEWTSVQTVDNSFTASQLKLGWTYEYRVGAMATTPDPVFSPVGEVTIQLDNEERMGQCGVMPDVNIENQTPNEELRAGDVVFVGGDFPMTITQVSSQGNGWYSGKGWLTLPWVFETDIAVKFNRLRINTDNRQIGGEVETETDPNASQTANLNELDYGGSQTTAAGIVFPAVEADFTVPEVPAAEYDADAGRLTIYDSTTGDVAGVVTVPQNSGQSIFPMIVEDADGGRYQVDMPAGEVASEDDNSEPAQPVITKLENTGTGFSTDKLNSSAGVVVRFSRGTGKYAFDEGLEPWYRTAMLIKSYYEAFGDDYIVPWKLIPVGLSDTVEAYIASGKADPAKIKFALKDGTGIAAQESGGRWTLTLPSVKAGETYEVFALSGGKTVGKLNVVSYPTQTHAVTLVPVNVEVPDTGQVERELNAIYSPYGVTFSVDVDDSVYGEFGWDIEEDGKLNLNGSGFFSRETDEMRALRRIYQSQGKHYDRNKYYIFVLDDAKAGEEPDAGFAVQGDMPRGKQFGYIFTQNVSQSETAHLIAHELGHGIFTLSHIYDNNYAGPDNKTETDNLMDYPKGNASSWGTNLAAFQWNVLANPAPITWFDDDEDSMMRSMPEFFKQNVVDPTGRGRLIHENAITIQNERDQTIAYILPDETIFYWVKNEKVFGYFADPDKPTYKNSYNGYCEDKYNRKTQPLSWGVYLATQDMGQFVIDIVTSPTDAATGLAKGVWKIVTLDFDIEKTWERIVNADQTDASYVISTALLAKLAGPKGKKLVPQEDLAQFTKYVDDAVTTAAAGGGKMTWPEVMALFRKGKIFEAEVSQHLAKIYPAEQGYKIIQQVYLKVDGVTSIADNLIYHQPTNRFILNETKLGASNTLRKNQKILQDAIKDGRKVEVRSNPDRVKEFNIPVDKSVTIKEIIHSHSIDGTITNSTVQSVWKLP